MDDSEDPYDDEPSIRDLITSIASSKRPSSIGVFSSRRKQLGLPILRKDLKKSPSDEECSSTIHQSQSNIKFSQTGGSRAITPGTEKNYLSLVRSVSTPELQSKYTKSIPNKGFRDDFCNTDKHNQPSSKKELFSSNNGHKFTANSDIKPFNFNKDLGPIRKPFNNEKDTLNSLLSSLSDDTTDSHYNHFNRSDNNGIFRTSGVQVSNTCSKENKPVFNKECISEKKNNPSLNNIHYQTNRRPPLANIQQQSGNKLNAIGSQYSIKTTLPIQGVDALKIDPTSDTHHPPSTRKHLAPAPESNDITNPSLTSASLRSVDYTFDSQTLSSNSSKCSMRHTQLLQTPVEKITSTRKQVAPTPESKKLINPNFSTSTSKRQVQPTPDKQVLSSNGSRTLSKNPHMLQTPIEKLNSKNRQFPTKSLTAVKNPVYKSSSTTKSHLPPQPFLTDVKKYSVQRPNLSSQKVNKFSLETPTKQVLSSAASLSSEPALTSSTDSVVKPNINKILINGREYLKMEMLGKGGSSEVFKVMDLETQDTRAVKVVDLNSVDEAGLHGYKNEIAILEKLQWSSRVIKLYDYEETDDTLLIVLEAGNLDLSCILKDMRGKQGTTIPAYTIKHYWEGMLQAVQDIHKQGIVHSDLKPANFLFVSHHIKLIDFGIASSIQHDMTSVFKDNPSGTINYMSPESLNDVHNGPIINGKRGDKLVVKIGVKSDVWSLGCILYNLVYGRTPFQHIASTIMKFTAISNPATAINFPAIKDNHLLDVMKCCLQYDSKKRPSIDELLNHPYLRDDSDKSKNYLQFLSSQTNDLTPNTRNKVQSFLKKLEDGSL